VAVKALRLHREKLGKIKHSSLWQEHDLVFPTRRGMAASLQGFVSGMVNVLTAGVVSPLVWHSPKSLAVGMLVMMLLGFGCWTLYLRTTQVKRGDLPPALPDD